MSAAEKLKTLDAKAVAPPWLASPDPSTNPVVFDLAYNDEDCEVIAALRNALPQIVAVVEAAEREHPEPHNYWAIDAEMNETQECPTCAALAALDEQLGDVT